jgi:site-specific DNA recombinase
VRAALYKRVSSFSQARDGYSLAFQEEIMRDYCKAHEWVITGVYEDGGRTGSNTDREGLQLLVSHARDRAFDVVLIFRVDRFSRDPLDLLFMVQQLNRYEIKLQSVTESIDTSDPAGELILTVLGGIGKFVRANIIQNAMLGKTKQAQQGRYTGGAVPFGYRVDRNGHLAADDSPFTDGGSPAELVAVIFRWYASGESLREIARRLTDRTEPARRWTATGLRQLLTNPVYLGDYVWGKTKQPMHGTVEKRDRTDWTVASEAHQPLIDRETWERVQGQLVFNRTKTGHKSASGDVLSGLLHCGTCGAMLTRRSPSKTTTYAYYTCGSRYNDSRRRAGTTCAFPFIRSNDLHAAVWSMIRKLATDPRVAEEAIGTADSVASRQRELATEIDHTAAALAALKRQEHQLLDLALGQYFHADVLAQKSADLRQRQAAAQHRLDALLANQRELNRSRPPWLKDIPAFQRYFAELYHNGTMSPEEERRIIHAAVSEAGILVFPDGRCRISVRVPANDPRVAELPMVDLSSVPRRSSPP